MTAFVDTNVLVYARDAAQPHKQPSAQRWLSVLWEDASGRVSAQVLNEFYVTVTRKLTPGMSVEAARADVRDLMTWRPVPTTSDLVNDAWSITDRYGISHWDALIVAGARQAGCTWLVSEDFQDGQDLDGITVVDPFRHEPSILDGSRP